tara:strand:+ start:1785 stop:2735 length:951 start_codon:yes stop_codon:yes gene_type:complete
MSSYVDREWYFYLRGRELLLYKLLGGSTSERITQSGVLKTQQNELMYPNEDIEDGLRIEYTALNEPFVAEALETTTAVTSSTTINFQVAASAFYTDATGITFTVITNGGSDDTITGFTDPKKYFYVGQSVRVTGADTGGNNQTYTVNAVSSTGVTVNETISSTESGQTITVKNNGNAILGGAAGTNTFTDFAASDKIRVQGSASNDGDYTISSISSNGDALVVSSAPSAVESAGERITVTQIPSEDASPDETSHVNLNRMLSLALVDYLKAMEADKNGDVQRKEYYMKEFYGKLGDNESNKRKISMSFPIGPFAVR